MSRFRKLFKLPFHDDNFESYLRLPMGALLIVGLGNLSPNRPKVVSFIYSAYTTLVLSAIVGVTLMMLVLTNWVDGPLNKNVSYFIAATAAIFQNFLAGITMARSSRNGKIDELIRKWKEYSVDSFLSKEHKQKIKKLIVAAFIYAFSSVALLLSLSSATVICGSKQGAAACFVNNVTSETSFLEIPFTLLLTCIWFSAQLLFYVTTVHAVFCWRALHEGITKSEVPFDKILEFTVKKHKELSEIISMINSSFGSYVFCILSMSLFTLISAMHSFSLLIGSHPLDIAVLASHLGASFAMTLIIASASLIYEEAEKVPNALYDRFREAYLLERENEADTAFRKSIFAAGVFMEHLRCTKIGIRPGGVFFITKKLFIAGLSILVTYYLSLAQFVQQPACPSPFVNGSAHP